MYVVTVLFELQPEHAEAFRAAILENATASMQEEGCRQFDVAFSEDGLRCYLYELYTDRAAFDAHLRTQHFLAYDRENAPKVKGKRVETYLLVAGSPAPQRHA